MLDLAQTPYSVLNDHFLSKTALNFDSRSPSFWKSETARLLITGTGLLLRATRPSQLDSWSLTFIFSKNMAISETKSHGWRYPYPVKEGQQYINLNRGHLFVQQPPKKEKGLKGSFKLLRQRPTTGGDHYHTARQN